MWTVCPSSKEFVLKRAEKCLETIISCKWRETVKIERNCDNSECGRFLHQPHRSLWSALEANSPFPRLEYFIKNCQKINILLTLFESHNSFENSNQLTFEYQTFQKMLKVCVENSCQIFHQKLKVCASACLAALPQKFPSTIHFCSSPGSF